MEVILKNVRLALPSLFNPFVPRDGLKPGQVAKYTSTFLFEPGSPNEAVMLNAMAQAAKAVWGEGAKVVFEAMGPNSRCMKSGNLKLRQGTAEVREGFAGMIQVVTSNRVKPLVVNTDLSPVDEASGIVYAGCHVNAKIDVYGLKGQGERSNGIFATLQVVQFVSDGDRFAGGGSAPTVSGMESLGAPAIRANAPAIDPFA